MGYILLMIPSLERQFSAGKIPFDDVGLMARLKTKKYILAPTPIQSSHAISKGLQVQEGNSSLWLGKRELN